MPALPGEQLALITGAGGTLGRAICLELARRGRWHLVAADIDLSAAEATVDALAEAHVSGEAICFDVADRAGWNAVAGRLRRERPHLDLLVNCAGCCAGGEVADLSDDVARRVLETNFFGTLYGCQTLLPWMKETGRGQILNIASIAGLVAAPGMAAYAAAKAAVLSLSEAMYGELRPLGIGVTVAAPGFFPSQLIARGDFGDEAFREMACELMQTTTLSPEAVARAAVDGIAAGRLYVVAGGRARRFWRVKRLAPTWLARHIAGRYQAWRRDLLKHTD